MPFAVSVVSNVRPLLFASLLAVTSLALPAVARADCSVAPLGSTDDLVVSFLAAQGGTQAAASTQFASSVKEGMLVYDDTTNAIRYCDGTNWVSLVGSGGGAGATAAGASSEVQFRNSSTGAFNADANFVWDNTNKRLGIGTATPGTMLHILGSSTTARLALTAPLTANASIVMQSKGSDGIINTPGNKGWNLNVRGDQHANTPYQNAFSFDYFDGAAGYNYFAIMPNGAVGMGAVPATSALMDLTSTTRGFLPPRMTEAQRDAIASPATGLVVYNTDTNALNYYNGSAWTAVGAAASGTTPTTSLIAGAQTLGNTGWTILTMATEAWDVGNMANLGTSTTRITIPAGQGGKYLMTGILGIDGNASGGRWIQAYINGSASSRYCNVPGSAGLGGSQQLACAWTFNLNAGDYVELAGYQNSGSTLNVTTNTRFELTKLDGGSGGGGGGGSTTLAGLTDVDTSAAANGKSLVYNSTSSKWEAQTITGASTTGFYATYSGVAIGTSVGDITGYTEQRDDGGNNFNPSTGVFTAPLAGYYVLTGQVNFTSGNSGFASVVLNVGGSNHCYSFETTNAGNYFRGCAAVVYMTAGQTAKLRAETQSGTTTASGMFTASLIGGGSGGGSSQWTTAGSDIHYGTGGVAIGQAAAPEATAALEIESTTKGFLPPRMTQVQRDAITSPAEGLVVYNTTTKSLDLRVASSWLSFGSSMTGNTMVPGWPDAILCNTTTPNFGTTFFYINISPGGDGRTYYRVASNTVGDYYIGFNTDGTYYAAGSTAVTTNCGTSIGALYSAGRAFNFIGGATASADGSAGQIQFNEGGNLKADAALHWDNTNKRLGIGTATPSSKLEIAGQDGLAITGYEPYITLRDTNASNLRALVQSKAGDLYLVPNSFIGGTPPVAIKTSTGNVGIGTATPAASALLDVSSTNKGFLPPRMTTTQRDAIASPAEGLVVYNTTTKSLDLRVASSWLSFGGGMTGNTMVSGWPDAIRCNVTNPNWGWRTLYLQESPYASDSVYRYREPSTTNVVAFNSDGTYNSSVSSGYTTSNCNVSISSLYANNRAFNFVGGATASADGSAGQVQFNEGGNLKADAALHWDNTNKRLGIGTATPTVNLDVLGGTDAVYLRVRGPTHNVQLGEIGSGGELKTVTNGSLIFGTNNTTRMTIDATGNVGIGTGNPANYKLVIDQGLNNVAKLGLLTTGRSSTEYPSVGYNVRYGGTAGTYTYDVNDTASMIRFNSGKVETFTAGAGTSGNTISFTTGPYVAQGGASWSTGSDARLKREIRTYPILDKLNGFRAVSFVWKETGKRDVGVIAQEIYKVFPEVVDKGDDDPDAEITSESVGKWGVQYDKLGALALQAVKELKAENDNLRAELRAANDNDRAQDAALDELRAQIEALKAAR